MNAAAPLNIDATRAAGAGGSVWKLVGSRQLQQTELPVPEPAAGEALVGISRVGLCGTDLQFFSGRPRVPRWSGGPWVLGHDTAGTVIAVGPDADAGLVGVRVTVDPKISCGACRWCAAGRPNMCERSLYLGMSTPGCLATHLTVPAEQAVPLPDVVSDDAATLLEPVAVALELLNVVSRVMTGPVPTAVIGGGPLGVVLASVLDAKGWPAHVFEPISFRRQLAAGVGVTALDAHATDIGDGPRLIVETSGSAHGVVLAEALAAPGSVMAVVAGVGTGFSNATILSRRITVLPVSGGHGHYDDAVALAAQGAIAGERLITHHYPFAAAPEAMAHTVDAPGEVMRVVVSVATDAPARST